MKITRFVGTKFIFGYCPRCKVVYYNKDECSCDAIQDDSKTTLKPFDGDHYGDYLDQDNSEVEE